MQDKTNPKPIPFAFIHRDVLAYLELARRHDKALSRCGWSSKMTAELEAAGARLKKDAAARLAATEAARRSTWALAQAQRQLKAFRTLLANAMRLANSAGATDASVRPFLFAALTNRGGAMLAWALSVRTSVAALDGALRPYLGMSALASLEGASQQLIAAVEAREAARRSLPAYNAKAAATRAEATSLMRQLRRTASLAFRDDPVTAREFRAQPRRPVAVAPVLQLVPAAA